MSTIFFFFEKCYTLLRLFFPLIRFQDLSRRYTLGGEDWKMGPISFSIIEGEKVAILGSSGSGKSTLLHLLGLLDTPTSGEIFFNDLAFSLFSERDKNTFRREKIGFVFQDFYLFPEFTLLENVSMSMRIANIEKKERNNRAMEVLERVGIAEKKNNIPKELSGGQRQRAAIARAIIHNPILLLADEPTGNLDHKNRDIILTLLKSLAEEKGMTLVFVTHDQEVSSIADKILHIEDGKLLSQK
jgi:ABC-type lipoprotein export system ATPase subunit